MYDLNNRSALNIESAEWQFTEDGDPIAMSSMMLAEMRRNNGIGLAANQIGLQKRMFVMGSDRISGFPRSLIVINPKIISVSQDTELDQEGCLSFPNLWLQIRRPKTIEAEYRDVKGDLVREGFSGISARCFQHEYDHLDGVCFVDKISRLKLDLAIKKSRKKQR